MPNKYQISLLVFTSIIISSGGIPVPQQAHRSLSRPDEGHGYDLIYFDGQQVRVEALRFLTAEYKNSNGQHTARKQVHFDQTIHTPLTAPASDYNRHVIHAIINLISANLNAAANNTSGTFPNFNGNVNNNNRFPAASGLGNNPSASQSEPEDSNAMLKTAADESRAFIDGVFQNNPERPTPDDDKKKMPCLVVSDGGGSVSSQIANRPENEMEIPTTESIPSGGELPLNGGSSEGGAIRTGCGNEQQDDPENNLGNRLDPSALRSLIG